MTAYLNSVLLGVKRSKVQALFWRRYIQWYIKNMEVHPDLAKERKTATFDPEKLTDLIFNGRGIVRRKRYLQNIIFNDKYLQSFKPWAYRNREEAHSIGLKKNVYMNQLIAQSGITSNQEQFFLKEAAGSQETWPLGLHNIMFIPTIEKQGTEEQKKYWVPLAKNWKIIGTYAQTEIGHGTFIRGLETRATYDPKTEEFVIHSPTLTSMKYWVGALGKTVTHVILMAQLYTQGKCHGIHAFVCPLRSLKDHNPLPGVTIGDIGNKYGYQEMDNGFLKFDNFRIPRDYMLMRYAKVLKDGTYVKPQTNSKIGYFSMVYVRSLIVGDSARALAQACTIATRYSAVRRQTELKPGGPEPQILDYQTQQEKLFPQIATAYALLFSGGEMLNTYLRISAAIETGQTEEMPVLHAIASGLKAVASWKASSGVDALRLSCGGHGYSHASGLPKIFINITPACTYEGENTVMMLQTARYLVKSAANLRQGLKLPGFMEYLSRPVQKSSQLTRALELPALVAAYEHRAARMIRSSSEKLLSLTQSGKAPEVAWNLSTVELVNAVWAHCEAYIVQTFLNAVSRTGLDSGVRDVLLSLVRLYAVHGMNQKIGEFLLDGYISSSQAEMLIQKELELYSEIRPNAVSLVDAFDYPDGVLQSCLGRYDGQVYKALYEYSKNSPFNEQEVLSTYEESLKPLMKGEKVAANSSVLAAKL